ncbi:MAG: hypothetical protein QW566_05175 [Candidatus Jordarchaeales archaeon]
MGGVVRINSLLQPPLIGDFPVKYNVMMKDLGIAQRILLDIRTIEVGFEHLRNMPPSATSQGATVLGSEPGEKLGRAVQALVEETDAESRAAGATQKTSDIQSKILEFPLVDEERWFIRAQ